MLDFKNLKSVAVGEAMVELAPICDGNYRRGFAGDTFNTAWHMAQILQARASVGFVTRVGVDSISNSFVAELAQDGLDVSSIGRDPTRNMGLYLIELEGAERSFHYWREWSAARGLASDGAALARAFEGVGLIHFSGITMAILPLADRETLFAALAHARANGARVTFDPNIRPRLWSSMDEARRCVIQALTLTDIALPSFEDEALMWGDATPEATIARLAAAGVGEVVVKNGAGPVWAMSGGAIISNPTPETLGICDTTGAGDGFNAGYLAARLLGHAPSKAVAAAQQFSGQVIRHFGARLPKALISAMV